MSFDHFLPFISILYSSLLLFFFQSYFIYYYLTIFSFVFLGTKINERKPWQALSLFAWHIEGSLSINMKIPLPCFNFNKKKGGRAFDLKLPLFAMNQQSSHRWFGDLSWNDSLRWLIKLFFPSSCTFNGLKLSSSPLSFFLHRQS